MLKQIDIKQAFELYLKGKDIQIIRPSDRSGRRFMYNMKEFVSSAIFLCNDNDVDDNSTDTTSSKLSVEVIDESVELHPKKDTNTIVMKSGRTLDMGKVIALRKAKWSYKSIAEELGVSQVTLLKYIKKYQLDQEVN